MAGNVPIGYKLVWNGVGPINSRQYECAFCGNSVAPNQGWFARSNYDNQEAAALLICHHCNRPTFIDESDRQSPGRPFGQSVDGIPDKAISDLYGEARKAMSASCYTASVLCCRKILMHIAVEKGANPGDSFVKYVEHLASANYIPPDAKIWVDHIRTKANEANHEIVVMTRTDAEELISFTEMLLKVIYEFPAAIKKRVAPTTPGP